MFFFSVNVYSAFFADKDFSVQPHMHFPILEHETPQKFTEARRPPRLKSVQVLTKKVWSELISISVVS